MNKKQIIVNCFIILISGYFFIKSDLKKEEYENQMRLRYYTYLNEEKFISEYQNPYNNSSSNNK